jgi:hypothetical protein
MKKSFYILEAIFESGNGPCPFSIVFEKNEDGFQELKRSAESAYEILHVWEGELTEVPSIVTRAK